MSGREDEPAVEELSEHLPCDLGLSVEEFLPFAESLAECLLDSRPIEAREVGHPGEHSQLGRDLGPLPFQFLKFAQERRERTSLGNRLSEPRTPALKLTPARLEAGAPGRGSIGGLDPCAQSAKRLA
jgi:hypothetical protein